MTAASRAALIGRLYAPRSIAVIGASSDPAKLGGRPVAYLARLGFRGAVYPITPAVPTMQGYRCYPDLDAVPGEIDAALILRPAEHVLEAVERCLRRGIRALVVLSGGFAEAGDEGRVLQARLAAMVNDAGAVLCGPNCAGLYGAPARATLSFTSNLENEVQDGGTLALVSNSGSIAAMVVQGRGHVFRTMAATGNEAVLTAADFIGHAVDDPEIAGVVAFVESIRDPQMLMAAARRALTAGKPIVVLKGGRTAAAAGVAATHTGALVDDDAVVDAMLAAHGVIRVRTIDELKAMAELMHAARGRRVGGRAGVVTPSGGTAVLITDEILAAGMSLPALAAATAARITAIAPTATPANPLDVTGFAADAQALGDAARAVVDDPGIDVVFAPLGGAVGPGAHARVRAFAGIAAGTDKLVLPIWQATTREQPGYAALASSGLAAFTDYALAARSVGRLARYAADRSRTLDLLDESTVALPAEATDRVRAIRRDAARSLNEHAAKRLLAAAGVAVPAGVLIGDAKDPALAQIAFPAVLKIASADILHKSAAGGVAFVNATSELPRTMDVMRAAVGRAAPQARIDGFLIESMVLGGTELLVGARRDPRFGATLSVAAGGVLANDLGHPATARLPLGERGAQALVARFSPSLAASAAGADLVVLIARVAALAVALGDRLDVLEINPVKLVGGQARAAWALDAVIALAPLSPSSTELPTP